MSREMWALEAKSDSQDARERQMTERTGYARSQRWDRIARESRAKLTAGRAIVAGRKPKRQRGLLPSRGGQRALLASVNERLASAADRIRTSRSVLSSVDMSRRQNGHVRSGPAQAGVLRDTIGMAQHTSDRLGPVRNYLQARMKRPRGGGRRR